MSDLQTSQSGFTELIGFQLDEASGDRAAGRLVIDERHLQPMGLVHGGLYATIGESLASVGTFVGVGGDKAVSGMSNFTSFLRPVFRGDTITAVAVPRHRGRTTWVWEVDMTNAEGKLCATTRVTMAVRELPAP